MRVIKCFAQEHNTVSPARAQKPRLLNSGTSTLTMRPLHLTSMGRVCHWILSGTGQYAKQCLVNNPCILSCYRERHAAQDNLCGPQKIDWLWPAFETTLSILFRFEVPPNSVIAQWPYLTTMFQVAFSASIFWGMRVHNFVLGCHLGFGNCGRLGQGNICQGKWGEGKEKDSYQNSSCFCKYYLKLLTHIFRCTVQCLPTQNGRL